MTRGVGFVVDLEMGLYVDGAACTLRGSMASNKGNDRETPRPRKAVRRERGVWKIGLMVGTVSVLKWYAAKHAGD